jgi:hypothetical protein
VGKFIPVEPEKWAEMVKALAEVASLKALTAEMDKTINASQAECRRLKAEVERLMIFCNCTLIPSKELQAQVERLTKAGDELHAFLINYIVDSRISSAYLNKLDDEWNAAKKGGQP